MPITPVRLPERTREAVDNRAASEADGNASEILRRLIDYGLEHMPAGWNPEEGPRQ